jgi:hypothetical protein
LLEFRLSLRGSWLTAIWLLSVSPAAGQHCATTTVLYHDSKITNWILLKNILLCRLRLFVQAAESFGQVQLSACVHSIKPPWACKLLTHLSITSSSSTDIATDATALSRAMARCFSTEQIQAITTSALSATSMVPPGIICSIIAVTKVAARYAKDVMMGAVHIGSVMATSIGSTSKTSMCAFSVNVTSIHRAICIKYVMRHMHMLHFNSKRTAQTLASREDLRVLLLLPNFQDLWGHGELLNPIGPYGTRLTYPLRSSISSAAHAVIPQRSHLMNLRQNVACGVTLSTKNTTRRCMREMIWNNVSVTSIPTCARNVRRGCLSSQVSFNILSRTHAAKH